MYLAVILDGLIMLIQLLDVPINKLFEESLRMYSKNTWMIEREKTCKKKNKCVSYVINGNV